MSDILCVTNRALCKVNFLSRIEEIARSSVAGLILREKDLDETEYKHIAAKVMTICENNNIPCILHNFINTAIELKADKIHLPMHILRNMSDKEKESFTVIGASCHSVDDVMEAARLGCTYITAGHIFATDCKKDMPPRGISFLHSVCKSVSIPVYAIGGIDENNMACVRKAGASGACIMSGLMRCENVTYYMKNFEKEGVVNEIQ